MIHTKYNAKSCIKEINKRIEKTGIELLYNDKIVKFNQYHFQLFTGYFGIKKNERFCFIYEISIQPNIVIHSRQYILFLMKLKGPRYNNRRSKKQNKKANPRSKGF